MRPYLRDAFEAAEPGEQFVVTRYRDRNANLRTHFVRIIQKAGVKLWAKPWQNLRSTRQTELAETFPIHVVCAWIGNSEAVATEHYLQVTDAHFVAATAETAKSKIEAKSTRSAAQNPAQYPAELVGMPQKRGAGEITNYADFLDNSAQYGVVPKNDITPKGSRIADFRSQNGKFLANFEIFWL